MLLPFVDGHTADTHDDDDDDEIGTGAGFITTAAE